jgi:hypothetical protein
MRGGNNSDAHSCLVRACSDYLSAIKAWHFKVHGHLGQVPGLPDVIGCMRVDHVSGRIYGQLIAVEVKTGSAQLTAKQREVKADIVRNGGLYVEVRRIEDLETALYDAGLVRRRLLT